MRFGLFGGARSRSGTPVGEHQGGDSQGYRDYINYVREAEDLGFRERLRRRASFHRRRPSLGVARPA